MAAVLDLPEGAAAREHGRLVHDDQQPVSTTWSAGPGEHDPDGLRSARCSRSWSGSMTGVLSAWRRGTVADHGQHQPRASPSTPSRRSGSALMLLILPVRRAPAPRQDARRVPVRPVLLGALGQDVVQHMAAAVAHARPDALRRVHADRALGDARDARRGLHPDRAGQGPARSGRSSAATPCGTRCCRSITLVALSLGYIVAGAILIETVFSWPGIGLLPSTRPFRTRDYPMLQGAFLVLTLRWSSSTSSPTSSTSSSTRGSRMSTDGRSEPGPRRGTPPRTPATGGGGSWL